MMYKGFLTASAVAVFAFAGAGPARASVFDLTVLATPGLLGYYPFTPTSQANSVVNGYTGVLQNGATIGGPGSGPPVNDPNSSALVLNNGASGTAYATAGGDTPLLGQIGNAGSIIAWINLNALPSARGRTFSIAGESQVGNDLDLQIDTDNVIRFYTEGGGSVGSTALAAADLGTFIFVAATFTANQDRNIYINGVLQGTNTPGAHSANTAPFYQGQSNVFGGRYFDGEISDVGLFNTDLTAAQVAALYDSAALGGPAQGVPEPSSLALLGMALLGSGLWARRRRVNAPG